MYPYNPYMQNYANYQNQPSYNQAQPTYNQPQQAQDERIWVQNETSAEAYLLAPNGFARLWDSSKPVFYEKRADATGRPLPMDIYKYERVLPNVANFDNNVSNLSKEEIDAKFEEITQRIEALESTKKVTKNAKQQSNNDDTAI